MPSAHVQLCEDVAGLHSEEMVEAPGDRTSAWLTIALTAHKPAESRDGAQGLSSVRGRWKAGGEQTEHDELALMTSP